MSSGIYQILPHQKLKTALLSFLIFQDIVNRALKSCPDGIRIESSQARTGYLGAWAEKDFSVNTIFGRYDGIVVQKEADNVKLIVDGGYAWEVHTLILCNNITSTLSSF